VEIFRDEYAQTNLLLRLPFCEAMSAFPHIEDIPLVASPGVCRREEIARLTGSDPKKRWILLSFTTLEWDERALAGVEQLQEYEFFTVHPLAWQRCNIHALDRECVDFSSVVASIDAVISKPGFGILSDCVVNQKPLIYADRNDFAEYAVLETAIRKYLKHIHIPAADLYRGDLRRSVESIWERPDPVETLPSGGDKLAAHRIMQFH
jgi:L-arabinokinase